MLKDPADTCAICLDGIPVGVIPSGACKGEGGCEKCLDTLREALPSHADVEAPRRRRPLPVDDDTGLAEERYAERVAARGWR